MRETQCHRRLAFRTQLLQYDPEPRDAPRRIEVAVKRGQRFELLVRGDLVDVDAACPPPVEHCVLLHQVIGDRIDVEDRVADRLRVADPQHSQVHLLYQVLGVGSAADAPAEERLQGTAVLGKQALNQGRFPVSHGYPDA